MSDEAMAMTDEPRPDPCAEMRARHRECQREYQQRSEVREHRREYQREYRQRPEVKERALARRQRPEAKARKRAYDQQRRAPATITCADCGNTASPAETETGGVLICMWCGSAEVQHG